MKEKGFGVGGEQSGHIILSKYATTGDGLLTAIKLMDVVMDTHKSLGELAAPVTVYPQKLTNVRVTDKATTRADADVQAAVAAAEAALGADGRVLVRESGTEPVIRVMAEAPTDEQCAAAVDSIVAVIKKKGYAV